jgi:hypothetical protein
VLAVEMNPDNLVAGQENQTNPIPQPQSVSLERTNDIQLNTDSNIEFDPDQKLTITEFPYAKPPEGKEKKKAIGTTREFINFAEFQGEFVVAKPGAKNGLCYVGGVFENNHRTNGNLKYRNMITVDIDNPLPDSQIIENLNKYFSGWEFLKHLTSSAYIWNEKKDKFNGVKYRVLIPLADRITTVEGYEQAVTKVIDIIAPNDKNLSADEQEVDHSCLSPSLVMFYPRSNPGFSEADKQIWLRDYYIKEYRYNNTGNLMSIGDLEQLHADLTTDPSKPQYIAPEPETVLNAVNGTAEPQPIQSSGSTPGNIPRVGIIAYLFNEVYRYPQAITSFLSPEFYDKPSKDLNRWHWATAESSGCLLVDFEKNIATSLHGTDPAKGRKENGTRGRSPYQLVKEKCYQNSDTLMCEWAWGLPEIKAEYEKGRKDRDPEITAEDFEKYTAEVRKQTAKAEKKHGGFNEKYRVLNKAVVRKASDVKTKRSLFLDYYDKVIGQITMPEGFWRLDGSNALTGGAGKGKTSYAMTNVAKRITLGETVGNGLWNGKPQNILIYSSEEEIGELKQTLISAGADMDRVMFLDPPTIKQTPNAIERGDEPVETQWNIVEQEDYGILKDAILENEIGAVFFSSKIRDLLGGKNPNENEFVDPFMSKVAQLHRDIIKERPELPHLFTLFVCHPPKGQDSPISGADAFIGGFRTVVWLEVDKSRKYEFGDYVRTVGIYKANGTGGYSKDLWDIDTVMSEPFPLLDDNDEPLLDKKGNVIMNQIPLSVGLKPSECKYESIESLISANKKLKIASEEYKDENLMAEADAKTEQLYKNMAEQFESGKPVNLASSLKKVSGQGLDVSQKNLLTLGGACLEVLKKVVFDRGNKIIIEPPKIG